MRRHLRHRWGSINRKRGRVRERSAPRPFLFQTMRKRPPSEAITPHLSQAITYPHVTTPSTPLLIISLSQQKERGTDTRASLFLQSQFVLRHAPLQRKPRNAQRQERQHRRLRDSLNSRPISRPLELFGRPNNRGGCICTLFIIRSPRLHRTNHNVLSPFVKDNNKEVIRRVCLDSGTQHTDRSRNNSICCQVSRNLRSHPSPSLDTRQCSTRLVSPTNAQIRYIIT